jgi:mannose-6-phosphate isomerase-like protein (cupin superfamily)
MYLKESESDGVNVRVGSIYNGPGTITSKWFFRHMTSNGVSLWLYDVEPGAGEGNHLHEPPHNFEELYHFIEGQGVMSIDGEEVPVATGDAVLIPPGVDHGFINTGPARLRVIIVTAKPPEL